MAIFRVSKTKGYTIMANHHLKNRDLSLKAKGLLSLILSLPDDWNYTTRGLSAICKDGVESIGNALKELEKAGYIVRNRIRDGKGRITDIEYIIYETPHEKPEDSSEKAEPAMKVSSKAVPDRETPDTVKPYTTEPDTAEPDTGNPDMDNPDMDNPYLDEPDTEKPVQSNIHRSNTHQPKTKKSTTLPANPSDPHPSKGRKAKNAQAQETPSTVLPMVDVDKWRQTVRRNIGYDALVDSDNREQLDNLVELIVETLCSSKSHIAVAGESYPAPLVKQRLLTLNSLHIQYVLSCLRDNTSRIRNIKRYLLTTLFNAPATMGSYYDAAVRHDRAKLDEWCSDCSPGGVEHD